MTPAETITTVSPVFGPAGAAWYFTDETIAAGNAIGLDGFRFYFLGRGGTLGDVDWQVVCGAFGYFNQSVVERMWTTANERCDRATAVAAHLAACEDFGRRHLAGLQDADGFCAAAEALIAAGAADLGGLPLFAGYVAQALPDDLPARVMRLVATLREFRGSAHLAAVVAAGLPTPVAHRLRRPDALHLFGWSDTDIPDPTNEDRARLTEADTTTDRILERAYDRLDKATLNALTAGASRLTSALSLEPPVTS